MKAQTLYDKIIELHTIENLTADGKERLVYIDRTVVNEYTSPQAFSLLRENKLQVWRPCATLGTVDHVNSSAPDRTEFPSEENSCTQVKYLLKNGTDFNFEVLNNGNPKQGIEHVVMVERGKVLPGMLIGAGDSHTAMYGALGAVAYGIGTSDIYHYLATSTLRYKKLKNMRVCVTGQRGAGVSAKDIILFIVKKLGAGGCTGHCVEFCGPVISDLTAEASLILCNMAFECAARSSVIAPDEKVFEYLKGKECSPTGKLWDEAVSFWRTLRSDSDAAFDKEETINITGLEPSVTWGTSPDQNCFISEAIPNPEEIEDRLNNMPYVCESLIIEQDGKLVALVYPDIDNAQHSNISGHALETLMEENISTLNKELPAYSQISRLKIYYEEFEKTPKRSIKRYLYQSH